MAVNLQAIWNKLSGKRQSEVRGATEQRDGQEIEEVAPITRDPYAGNLLNRFVDKPAYGPQVVQNPDPVLALDSGNAPVGYRFPLGIYRALVDKDAQVFSSFQQLFSLILDARMTVVPDGEDKDAEAAADLLRTALLSLRGGGLQTWLHGCLSALPYGFHVTEAIWALDELPVVKADGKRGEARKVVWASRMLSRDQRRYVFDTKGHPRLLTSRAPLYGEELSDDLHLVFRPYMEYENPYGEPLLRRIYWLCKLKHLVIKWWASLGETYGFPIPVVKPARTLSKDEKAALREQIDDIRQSLGLILPNGTDLDFSESGRASSEMFHTFILMMDGYIARTILSQDFTVQQAEKGGTRSAGEVYAEAASRLARMHAAALGRFITNEYGRRLTDWNFGYRQVPYPRVEFDTSTVQDKMNRSIMYQGLSQLGFEISSSEVEQTMKVQRAIDESDKLKPPTASGPIDPRKPYDKTENPAGQSNRGGIAKTAAKANNA